MSRIMVLIEDDEGGQAVWDVFDVDVVEWTWAGVDRNGSRAKLVVEGSFHRRHSTPEGRQISERMRRMLE